MEKHRKELGECYLCGCIGGELYHSLNYPLKAVCIICGFGKVGGPWKQTKVVNKE